MLTNERLKEIAEEYMHAIYPEEVGDMARDLLAIREAGDEEVDRMMVGIANDSSLTTGAKETVKILRHIAIARGQQLREIRSACPCNCHNQPSSKEAMGLEEHANCGECIKGLLEEAESMQDSLCQKYEAELREAQAEIESYESQELETTQVIINHRNFIADQKKTIDSLTAELAALKSAPRMEEVDAMESQIKSLSNPYQDINEMVDSEQLKCVMVAIEFFEKFGGCDERR